MLKLRCIAIDVQLLLNKIVSNLLAQNPIDIGKEWILKPSQPIGNATQFQTPGAFISILLKNIYVLAGVMLLVLLIFGGISIIMGGGKGDPRKAGQGKKVATAAVIGFFVIFLSYWIVKIIETVTGVQILNPPQIPTPGP